MSSIKSNKILIELVMVFLLTLIAIIPVGTGNFILPPQGGGVIHQDLNMSENLWYPCPTHNVGQLWYQDDLWNFGVIAGTMGNGIVGNGNIAACAFGPFSISGSNLRPNDKLLLFDYFGNILWRCGPWNYILKRGEFNYSLNPYAAASSPMIDIHNRIVACDTERIILVNASDPNDITVDWIANLTKLSSQDFNNRTVPFSPCPVGNQSFILPTKNGPVYLFDVETGTQLANITLGKNTTLGDYWGIPKMSIADSLKIHLDCILREILPYRYNETSGRIEWNSEIQYGIMPLKRNLFIDYIHGKAFFSEGNTVIYKERVSPFNWTIIARNEIQAPSICTGEGYFSTINSACVDGNKVYLATEYTMPGFWQHHIFNLSIGFNNTIGRLYAINVTPNAVNESDRLVEYWNYTYFGKSQATPTLIDDTIYFDGYNNTILAANQDPHIYAVRTDGTEKWKIRIDGITTFTMTTDPRGGFWYEDADQWPWRPFDGNNKLFRYYNDSSYNESETIDMKTILHDTDHPYSKVIPSSDMTICGTPTYPIMLISANHPRFQEGKWVLAINLTTNTQIWNVSVPPYVSALNLPWPYINHSLGDFNYAVGDYTILQWHNQSRILFPTYPGGMMAIGQYPNCSLETINYQPKDTFIQDPDNDAVQVNYTINSIIPDRVRFKVTLISSDHPILCSYKTESSYDVTTPAGIQDSLTNILPPRAPKGYYKLRVDLYNSSGNMSFPRKANESYQPNEQFYLTPPITPPQTPHQPIGETNVTTNTLKLYKTNTTDTNNFSIWYQWRYQTQYKKDGEIKTRYTTWILGGPYQSGENCTRGIIWSYPGTYNISVHAKNVFFNPNVMSDWSENLTVNVTYANGGGAAWNPDLLDTFTMDTIAVGQQTSCSGFAQGVIIDPSQRGDLNWTWDFGDGNISWGENATHNYTQPGNYTIHLSIRDDTYIMNSTRNITVLILNAGFQTTGDWKPDQKVIFNDTSAGFYPIVNWTWDFGDGNISYNQNMTHNYTTTGIYNVTLIIQDNQSNIHSIMHPVFVEVNPSELAQVTAIPKRVGPGSSVTINTDLLDNESGLREIHINITFPDSTTHLNTSLIHNNESVFDYTYFFNNTWQIGIYNYSIWTKDNANNTHYTQGFNFTVSANASVSICTVKDTFGPNEYINLTDPPSIPTPPMGSEFLDDGSVLHLWNQYDNYYFNTSSGIQLTNHYNQYWSQNVLMLGYYNNDQWNLIYRTDELTGFMKSIETDNVSFVNATLWKDLTYNGYAFRLAIRYHLGIDDRELTVIPYIKNLGVAIPYTLGFAWEVNDIQVAMTPENDYLEINGTRFPLNESTDVTYKHLVDPTFSINEILPNDVLESLSLRWSESLNYLVWVKTRAGEYNAPVILGIKIGTLSTSQEKHTELLWHDASQMTYYFNHHDRTDIWATNPDNMVDGNLSKYASTTIQNDVELCDTNTCNGTSLGTISKVELRTYGYCSSGHRDIILQPVFNGHDHGNNYSYSPSSTPAWSSWFDITNDPGRQIFGTWNWSEIQNLDCDVTSQYIQFGGVFNLLCSKIELRVTYNNAPIVSNPVPPHGSNGIDLRPWLNITVADPNGDTMNLTWYSNSTPSFLSLRPNANGSTTQLERYPTSQNANYKCIDETLTNDSDYVKWKGTSWKKDTYNLPNHSSQTGVIHDVTVYARCARVGSVSTPTTTSSAKIVIRSGGTDYYGTEFKPPHSMWPPITYTNYLYTWKNNPATGNAWSWTDIDNLQAGITFIGNEGTSECTQLYVVVNYTNPNTWLQFGRNSSIDNGTYRQRFLNASVNGQWWYWKVNVDDGTLSTWSSVYKFYTGYQSKIENTGDTNISGYLLMQVQFYNTTQGKWLVDKDTINETSPRTITMGNQLGLDIIFNGHVRASNLTHGTGTYRVYAAFRDPKGNILRTDDDTEIAAWWQFSKT